MNELFDGGGLVIAGVILGRFLPARRKNPKLKPPSEPICGCGHHFSFHAPATGICKGTNRRVKYSGGGSNVGQHDFPCGCQVYSGPTPMPEFIP